MRRFFVEPHAVSQEKGQVTITERNDINHIKNVLRMKPGDKVSVSDGTGNEYDCVIEKAGLGESTETSTGADAVSDCIVLSIKETRTQTESSVSVTLYTGLPKQGKMEVIVQKATELGTDRIVPVYMKRSIPKDKGGIAKKMERWQRVALEASKQSRRTTVPEVKSPIEFADAVTELADCDQIIFPYENERGTTIRDILETTEISGNGAFVVALMVGPEGGFSEEEVASLIAAGAVPCSLGRTILRTETAGMAALAMIRYAYDL